MIGFYNLLEAIRYNKPKHFIYASSSSIYGKNKKVPFSISDKTDSPVSLYAATKKSNEILAHSYASLYKIPMTGLRFFTVYGPFGRPDMAYFKFTKAIIEDKKIDIYNNGAMKRDFTYIDDIIDGLIKIIEKGGTSHSIYNLGNNKPVDLMYFIKIIEKIIGKKAKKNMLQMQAGDVPITYADIGETNKAFGFEAKTNIEDGLKKFIDWYKAFFL